jgi:hypothetical protein
MVTGQEIDLEQTQTFAFKADHLLIGAFDDMGWLIWTRPSPL